MALATYTELVAAYREASGDGDTSSTMVDTFIALLEARANRILRHRRMEATATVTMTSGSGPLPSDYLQWRKVRMANRVPLEYVSPDYIDEMNPYGSAGDPAVFTITGTTIKTAPTTSSDLTLWYYGRIAALTSSAPTNWLLTYAPDVYHYGILLEYAIHYRDEGGMNVYGQLLKEAFATVMSDDHRATWPRAGLKVRGDTP